MCIKIHIQITMQQADVAHVLNQGTYRSGIFLRKTYLSLLSVRILPSLLIISIPLQTLPNKRVIFLDSTNTSVQHYEHMKKSFNVSDKERNNHAYHFQY